MTRPGSPVHVAIAVTGGLAFIASLACAGRLYAITLGEPIRDAPPVAAAVLANVGLFGLFGAHHSLLARARAKAWVARLIPPALERSAFVWVSSVLFAVACLAWQPIAGETWRLEGPWRWLGLFLQLAGAVLTLASARAIDLLELAGVRQVLAPRPEGGPLATDASQGNPPISTAGPYGVVRHPIYLGWILMVFGAPQMTAGRLAFATISTAYLLLAIPFEERSLATCFGQAYHDYARVVRWRVIPGVY